MIERNTDIELVYKDIKYIKEDVAEIKASLKLVLEHYITRQEVDERIKRIELELDERVKGANAQIDTKADIKDVDKINATISKVAWLIIAPIVVAVLGLIISNQ